MERPTGVTILAVLSFILAALMVLGALGMFFLGAAGIAAATAGRGMGGPLAALGAFGGVVILCLAVLYIITGVGLIKLRSWGRLLTIILVAISVIFGLMGIVRALVPLHAGILVWQLIVLAIDVWILMYMFKPHVKAAFEQTA